MRINYLSSYDRSFRKLPPHKQEKTIKAIDTLLEVIETGQKPEGLGLKKLALSYWEIRVDIYDRVIFEFSKDSINFCFVGNHNSIRNFIRGR